MIDIGEAEGRVGEAEKGVAIDIGENGDAATGGPANGDGANGENPQVALSDESDTKLFGSRGCVMSFPKSNVVPPLSGLWARFCQA